eukprot:m.107509 g.107509  ORF g.107509 m.107509 type:complete len:586 (+) comp10623_c0_seq1:98-1855(+)
MPDRVPLFVVIAGPPGAGKGTQCEQIVREFGLIHLSTGDIIRAAIKSGSALGKEFQSYTSAGKLVPDELVVKLVCDAVNSRRGCRTRGWLLDGFPRTAAQAAMMPKLGLHPDLFLVLNVPDHVLEERICNRRTDPVTGTIYNLKFKPPPTDDTILSRLVQRKDDTKEALDTRLGEFHAHMKAVESFFEDIATTVDGTKPMEDVTRATLGACAEVLHHKIADHELPNWLESVGHAAAGGSAGVVAMAMIYPIDTIKTRLQLEQPAIPPGLAGWPLVMALYAGLPLGLLETGAVHGTSFLAYEFIKGLWIRATLGRALQPGEEPPVPPFLAHTMLGCLASFFTQTVTLPLKIILVRVQGGKATGFMDAARQVLKESGPKGFFAGLTSNLFMMINPAITFIVYERLIKLFVTQRRESLTASRPSSRPTTPPGSPPTVNGGTSTTTASLSVPNGTHQADHMNGGHNEGEEEEDVPATGLDQLIAGFVAKAIATAVTFPAQKTQAMVQGSAEFQGSQIRAILSLVRDGGGVLALWRGLAPKLFQAALQQSLIFRFKEPWARLLLDAIRADRSRTNRMARSRSGTGLNRLP